MTLKKILITIVSIIIFGNYSYAQNDGAGNTGLSFLKLGVGAESIAMGEAFASLSDDASAVVYNPARLSFGDKTNVMAMHNSSVQDLTNDFVAAKFSLGTKLSLGVGLLRSGVNDIEIRTIPGESQGTFNSDNLSLGISLAYLVNPTLSIGMTSKFLYEKIYVDDASGVGFDVGANYVKDNLSLAFVIANFGEINELKDEATKLPTSLRLGGGYKFGKNDLKYRIGLEGFKVLDGGSFHIHSGGEVGYKDFLFVRAGYQSGYENKGITTGIGFKYKGIKLDYAFIPYTNEFGNSNTFSLGISFN